MQEIELTRGLRMVVDECDYRYLYDMRPWHVNSSKRGILYAVRECRDDSGIHIIAAHRVVFQSFAGAIGSGQFVDHINHDGLDNRRSNLRASNNQLNAANSRKRAGCSSLYKGVTWDKGIKKWRAMVRFEGDLYHLGSYRVESEAAKAYNEAAVKYFGSHAHLNVIDEK